TYFKNDANDYLPNFVQHGASCRLSGEVSPALSATNPHQFDYQNYLWQQGIQAQFLISHIEDIKCENKSLRSSIYEYRKSTRLYSCHVSILYVVFFFYT